MINGVFPMQSLGYSMVDPKFLLNTRSDFLNVVIEYFDPF